MKTIKFLLVSLFMMLGLAAQAQQVVINKTDGTADVFQPNEVDSVVYKPAPKYYYYAGWECPTNEEELARLAVAPNGGIVDMTKTYTTLDPLRLYDGEVTNSTVTKYYVIIPNDLHLYDSEGEALVEDCFDIVETTIPNHKIFNSQLPAKRIAGVMIR